MKRKIIIRPAKENDAEEILDIYAPYILDTPVSFEMEVPDIDDFKQRIIQYQKKLPWLVCQHGDTLTGYAYATDHRQRRAYDCTKELSVYVHQDFRNGGIATGLYTSLIDILKLQGITNVLAGITLPNPESVGFHERFGFKLVGIYHKVGFKLGRYHDAGWWELPIGDDKSFMHDIVGLEKIVDSEGWHKAIQTGVSKVKEI